MPGLKTGIALAVALAMTAAAPAFAEMSAAKKVDQTEAARRTQSSQPAPRVDRKSRKVRTTPAARPRPEPHRYFGRPKAPH